MFGELLGNGCCVACGAPGDLFCEPCRRGTPAAPPVHLAGVDRAVCAWQWSGAPRHLVLGLKLRAHKACSRPLGRGTAEALWRIGTLADVVTWVPGRPSDTRRRGFDHARSIAEEAARSLGLRSLPLLSRSGNPQDQVGLGREERLRNQSHAFRARPFTGAVLVVDDLVTTGATARACAVALRESGAPWVEVATPCRA